MRTQTSPRRGERIAGILYLLTFATSIPALALKQPALDAVLTGSPTADALHVKLVVAILLELVLALACVGTAIALYPSLRRFAPGCALGFVASRTVEAALIAFGVIALLVIAGAFADESSAAIGSGVIEQGSESGRLVVTLHDAAFLIGPGTLPLVNALLLAPVLLRERLMPRAIPVTGLIGAAALATSVIGTLAAGFAQVSAPAALLAIPIALWEFALGIWLLARGLKVR